MIGLGLLSRRYPVFGNYPGDALWAVLECFLWAIVLPTCWKIVVLGLSALSALLVEFSQLIDHAYLDTLRGTTLGRLALGSGFDPVDLVAYALGIILANFVLSWLASFAEQNSG